MDVFERVREVELGSSLTSDQVAEARHRLLEGIDVGIVAARKRAARRPLFIIAGAVAGVAAATGAVLVVSQLAAPATQVEAIPAPTVGPRQPAEAIPHPTPTSATGISEPFPGTTPQAGQYLSVQSVTETLLYRDGRVFQWWDHGEYPPIGGLLVRGYMQVYVPGDRSGEWVSRFGPDNERIQFFPEDQGPAGELAWDNQLPVRDAVDVNTSVGGLAGDVDPPNGSDAYYAQFPADPQSLLDLLRTRDRGFEQTTQEMDEAAVAEIVDVLRSNYAPADVRATFINALVLSGRASVESSSDGITTYRITYAAIDSRSDTVSVADATGWVTEYTLRWDRGPGAALAGDMVPSNIPDLRMTYAVSIVNAIP